MNHSANQNYVRDITNEFQRSAIQAIRTIVKEGDDESEEAIAGLLSALAGISAHKDRRPFNNLRIEPIVELFPLSLWRHSYFVCDELLNLAIIPMLQTHGLETILHLYESLLEPGNPLLSDDAREDETHSRFYMTTAIVDAGRYFLDNQNMLSGFNISEDTVFKTVIEDWSKHHNEAVAGFAMSIRGNHY